MEVVPCRLVCPAPPRPRGRGAGQCVDLLDLTPYGRQEDWEDAPEGVPQTARYEWWRRHDEYH